MDACLQRPLSMTNCRSRAVSVLSEGFSDPIAALLNDTDFEPSVVSLASILIDALRLLGNQAGDIMEMKARHEAYVREGRCRQAD